MPDAVQRFPSVEALGASGAAYVRSARTVGELPTVCERKAALVRLATLLGVEKLPFGAAYYAGWSRTRIKQHGDLAALHTPGCDLPLSLLTGARALGQPIARWAGGPSGKML